MMIFLTILRLEFTGVPAVKRDVQYGDDGLGLNRETKGSSINGMKNRMTRLRYDTTHSQLPRIEDRGLGKGNRR